MPNVSIRDIAVLAKAASTASPCAGEAPGKGETYSEVSPEARADAVARLQTSIFTLMDNAEQVHLQQVANDPDSDNYITRLSTNEFFFYTKAPLMLEEFQRLQEALLQKAATLPNGIHLALASFAVEIPDQGVMNVTPFIVCGDPVKAQFIVKNHTSAIDVTYQTDLGVTKKHLDRDNFSRIEPHMTLSGNRYPLSLHNVVPCQTSGGELFLTAVDICFDHIKDVTRINLDTTIKEKPETLAQPISQIVLSNSVALAVNDCIGHVMHTDPYLSKVVRDEVEQESVMEISLPFGNDKVMMYTLSPVTQQVLQEALSDNRDKIDEQFSKTKEHYSDLNHSSLESLEKLRAMESKAMTIPGGDSLLPEIRRIISDTEKINDTYKPRLLEVEKFEQLVVRLNQLKFPNEIMQTLYIDKQIVAFCKAEDKKDLLIGMESSIECLEEIDSALQSYAVNDWAIPEIVRPLMNTVREQYYGLTHVSDKINLTDVIDLINETIQLSSEHACSDKCLLIESVIPGVQGTIFARALREKFEAATSLDEKKQVMQEIDGYIHNLHKNQPLINDLHEAIANYRKDAGMSTVGMERKAKFIENVLANMTLDDYSNLHQLDDEHPLFAALASRRYLGGAISRTDEGKIDPKKAATLFKDFKRKQQEFKQTNQPDDATTDDSQSADNQSKGL
ncbi:MAG: hypothetical protein P1U32_07420 [Legionellaceae bacterium]|nr:hypothetical protein [Legionellaceae bacterium]